MLVSYWSRVVRKVLCLSLLSYLNIFSVQGNDGYLYLLIDRHLVFGKRCKSINAVGNILQSTHNHDGCEYNWLLWIQVYFIIHTVFVWDIFTINSKAVTIQTNGNHKNHKNRKVVKRCSSLISNRDTCQDIGDESFKAKSIRMLENIENNSRVRAHFLYNI